MRRLRLLLPPGRAISYDCNDTLHDALVRALVRAGAPGDRLVGPAAAAWSFAPLGRTTRRGKICHTLVLGTPDPDLAPILERLRPEDVVLAGGAGFAGAGITPESPPPSIAAGHLACLMLSPLAVSARGGGKRWHDRIDDPGLDLPAAVNRRLSRLSGRPSALRVEPDGFYVLARPDHAVRVPVKAVAGGASFVIGMNVPLVLGGPPEDLVFAWHAGIGEKNRMGFGVLGAVERGLGR